MYTQVVRPESLSVEALDAYLETGWYRMRQALFTCRFVTHGSRLVPAIWTRSQLPGLSFNKSQRKRMNKNRRLFTHAFKDVVLGDEHRALYRRYREHVGGDRPDELDHVLGPEPSIFQSQMLELRDADGRLVAYSVFDRGRTAIQSVTGVFDPDHARHSLGLHTMLAEVEYARDSGLSHHYAGYVLPGEPSMDYKLRVRQLEFWHPERNDWRPIDELDGYALPTDRIRRALDVADAAARAAGIVTRRLPNPRFDLGAWNPALSSCLEHPEVLACRAGPRNVLVVGWLLEERCFELLRCTPGTLQSADGTPTGELVMVVRERLARSRSPEFIANSLRRA
ncbi:MAG: hypothetical protein GY913_08475 [Proteobacteria bacterium]|nr:hypothetical protein [Pseudomonadota bacterium]MCP4916945.1 hypothetical protein [Pseudomonadota bacterium]